MINEHRKSLIDLGMKEALVAKLEEPQIQELVAFAMDNAKSSNLQQMLIQLASMEARNKKGAAYLASHGLANTVQLKSLSAEQISQVVEEYLLHADEKLAIKAVKDMIVANQQEKLYVETDGLKGEFYQDTAEDTQEEKHY